MFNKIKELWIFKMSRVIDEVIVPWAKADSGNEKLSYIACVNYAKRILYPKKFIGPFAWLSTLLISLYSLFCKGIGLIFSVFILLEIIVACVLSVNQTAIVLPELYNAIMGWCFLFRLFIFYPCMICNIVFMKRLEKGKPKNLKVSVLGFNKIADVCERIPSKWIIVLWPFKVIELMIVILFSIFEPLIFLIADASDAGGNPSSRGGRSYTTSSSTGNSDNSTSTNQQPDLQAQLRDSNERYGYGSYESKVIRDKIIDSGHHPDE